MIEFVKRFVGKFLIDVPVGIFEEIDDSGDRFCRECGNCIDGYALRVQYCSDICRALTQRRRQRIYNARAYQKRKAAEHGA